MNNLKTILPLVLKVTTVLFFFLMCYYHLQTIAGAGDEVLFINDLNFIRSNGWISAIEKGVGLTYMILAYPFSFILPDFIALRVVNILLQILLLIYFYRRGALKNTLFYCYFLFISSFGYFFSGTNDTLFIVAMVIFFNETYKFLEDKPKASMPLLWCSLFVGFFTRELVYIYIPLIALSLLLLWKKKADLFQKWHIPTLLLAFLILINLPSLQTKHRLCYDDKKPADNVKSNWAQRQYLAQLLVNEGKLPNLKHPSWEETDAYLIKNGENSLPKTTFDGIFFNLRLTILEFFKDFTSCVLLSIRQTGMIVIFVFLFLAYALLKRKITPNLYLPAVSFLVVAIFSFIIISYVETRWLIVAYIVAIIYYSDLEHYRRLPKILPLLNHIVLLLVIFYGSYRVFLKL